jgi:hypothetical protein
MFLAATTFALDKADIKKIFVPLFSGFYPLAL